LKTSSDALASANTIAKNAAAEKVRTGKILNAAKLRSENANKAVIAKQNALDAISVSLGVHRDILSYLNGISI
jgi:hypothetical protein